MGCFGRTHRAVLPGRQDRATAVFPANRAARSLNAAMVHAVRSWHGRSLFDTPLYREFAQLEEFGRLPDESTILRFGKTPSPRHRLEKHKLADKVLGVVNEILVQPGLPRKTGAVVDATLIAAPSSTKNKDHLRDPEMHSSKKGQRMYFDIKVHIGTVAESELVHTVRGTSGNVHDVVEGNSLLHGEEVHAFGDAGYQGITKRLDDKPKVTWHITMRPGKRKDLNKEDAVDAMIDKVGIINIDVLAMKLRKFIFTTIN